MNRYCNVIGGSILIGMTFMIGEQDHDIMRSLEWLGSEIFIFTMMLKNKPKVELEMDQELISFVGEYDIF